MYAHGVDFARVPLVPQLRVCLRHQDEAVELKDGAELRFGASTRAYVLRRPAQSRKRSVSWPDGTRAHDFALQQA